eukprot:Skav224638  [mRNA]  locus=scaffold1918:17234:22598:+ [translate_table: standard]
MEKLSRLGITYYRVMGDHLRSANWSYPTGMWQDRFQTDDWLLAKKRLVLMVPSASQPDARRGILAKSCDFTCRNFPGYPSPRNWTVPAVTFVNTTSSGAPTATEDNHRSNNYADTAEGAAAPAALHSTWGDGSEFLMEELQLLRDATEKSLEVQWCS